MIVGRETSFKKKFSQIVVPQLGAAEAGTAECAEDAETHPAFRGASSARGMGILPMSVHGRDARATPLRRDGGVTSPAPLGWGGSHGQDARATTGHERRGGGHSDLPLCALRALCGDSAPPETETLPQIMAYRDGIPGTHFSSCQLISRHGTGYYRLENILSLDGQ